MGRGWEDPQAGGGGGSLGGWDPSHLKFACGRLSMNPNLSRTETIELVGYPVPGRMANLGRPVEIA